MTIKKTYDEGLRDGKLQGLIQTQDRHERRLDGHSKRLALLERIAYIMVGAIALLELLPHIKKALG